MTDRTTLTVRDVILDLADSEANVYYFVPAGNAGDALIHLGFHQLARSVGLRYTCVTSPNQVPDDSLVVFGGGGGLAIEWAPGGGETASPSAANIGRLMRSTRRLIIMPQSLNGYRDLIAEMDHRVTLFLRERPSYELANQWAVGGASILLDHDTAFHLDANAFLSNYGGLRWRKPRDTKDLLREALYALVTARSAVRSEVAAFRADPERLNTERSRSRLFDLSLIASFGHSTLVSSEYTSYRFLKLISRYRHVRTDRLHIAIGAALLGKAVTLYDNSYHKCRGVFEFSLSNYHVTMGS